MSKYHKRFQYTYQKNKPENQILPLTDLINRRKSDNYDKK